MLDFSWQAQLQKVNRIGAPILFMEIEDPSEDDIAYGQKFLDNWGKNSGMQIRPNMKLIIPDLKDNSSAIDTINALSKMVVDYFTPASLIAKDGTLIGGSSAAEQELLLSYIRGTHSWITESFEQLLQTYLEGNAYQGYTARIYIPSPSIDKSEIWMKQALALGQLVKDGVTVADENEFRNLLEMEEKSPKEIAYLREVYERYRPVQETSAFQRARLSIDAAAVDPVDPYSILHQKQIKKAVNKALGQDQEKEEEEHGN